MPEVLPESVEKTIWLTRPDIRAICENNRIRFLNWLSVSGPQQYRALIDRPEFQVFHPEFFEPAPEAVAGVEPELNRFMKAVWDLRPDLQTKFDLTDKAGQQDFAWWFLIDGAKESDFWATQIRETCERQGLLSEPAGVAIADPMPRLTRFMLLVSRMRSDLGGAFELTSAEGRTDLAWWFFVHGTRELGTDRYLTEAQRRFLHGPSERIPPGGVVSLSRLMMRVWSQDPDLQGAFPLDTVAARTAFAGWFLAKGAPEIGLLNLFDREAAQDLAEPVTLEVEVSRIASAFWIYDDDLKARFPDPRRPDYAAWLEGEGQERFPILRRIGDLLSDHHDGILPGPRPAAAAPGFNLIGYARGQFGIGEDVRMAALAMRAAAIPFSIYNIEPGREVCQGDDSAAADVAETLPHGINLFCATGIETARLAAVEGERLFTGRVCLGMWPWELPEWPQDWWHAYELVDEVWAATGFTQEAYVKSSPKPVVHMPMTVTAEQSSGLTRRDFRLPARRFLFVFSFDALSSFARKNPLATVRAFRRAFPLGSEPVGMVIKVMRAKRGDANWEVFRAEAGADRRIQVINRTLDRGAVLDLYRACDCFLSLHRAEGFGRGIAEAMLLGKPVIATGYSGNVDFTTPETAALVDHRLVPVAEGEYPFATGLLWADVDVDHAAWWMKRLVEDDPLRGRLAEGGRALTNRIYSPAAVGARYRQAMERLAV